MRLTGRSTALLTEELPFSGKKVFWRLHSPLLSLSRSKETRES
jgi:hypothetical protein